MRVAPVERLRWKPVWLQWIEECREGRIEEGKTLGLTIPKSRWEMNSLRDLRHTGFDLSSQSLDKWVLPWNGILHILVRTNICEEASPCCPLQICHSATAMIQGGLQLDIWAKYCPLHLDPSSTQLFMTLRQETSLLRSLQQRYQLEEDSEFMNFVLVCSKWEALTRRN